MIKSPYLDLTYQNELAARFRARTPARVFDAHFHLSQGEIPDVPSERAYATYKVRLEHFLGEGKVQGGFLMATPARYQTQKEFDDDRQFSINIAMETPNVTIGLLATPTDTQAQMMQWIDRYDCIVGLKPYCCYAPVENTFEADILDFAPEWMWELADGLGFSVMLHLSHYGDMLKDKRNGEQLQYISCKYPHAKIVLAHCAMGHHPDKLKSGLTYLEGLENVWMDCSGVSEALSIVYALQALGAKKVLYGSDGYNFGFNMMGGVKAIGGNFLGVHDLIDLPPDYRYQPILNVCEGLQALYAAGDLCGLTKAQWEDIFYNNAAALFCRSK